MDAPPGLDAPLRTIWCVGRNYAEHAKELGHEAPKSPLIFLKPASALLLSGGTLRLPAGSSRVDHEVELVVARGRGGLMMAVGVDFTARDLQAAAKQAGDPWTSSKGRPGFAAIGPFVPLALPAEFSLSVNGQTRQTGRTQDMIFPVETLIAHVESVYGPLGPGDVLFTGTPKGIAPLKSGDRVEASLPGSRLELRVA